MTTNPTSAERSVESVAAQRERFRLIQHGIPVAWSEGPGALQEIRHYAAVYGQDGPVAIEHHSKGRWRKFRLPGQSLHAYLTASEKKG